MGGVAGQQHPARRVPLGDAFGGAPGRLAGDLDVQVGDADGQPDVPLEPLLGELLQRLALLRVPGRVEDPVLLVVDRQQGTVGLGVGEVAADEAPVADRIGEQLGPEGDAHVREEVAGAALPDAEPAPYGAARAVARDQVVRADPVQLVAVPVPDERRHSFGVLLEALHLVEVPQVPAERAGPLQQHRLQVVLAAQAPGRGAEPRQSAARVDVLEQPFAGVADQGRGLQDAMVGREQRGRRLDVRLDAGHPVQLHRPQVVAAATRVDRGPGVPLDEHVGYAETAQEQGEGQAHQRTAHDEDGHLVIGFVLHQGSRGRCRDVRRVAVSVPSGTAFACSITHVVHASRALCGKRHRIKKR